MKFICSIKFFLTFIFLFVSLQNIYSYNYNIKGHDIDIHGLISTGYLKSDSNNFLAKTEDGTFRFSEYGINMNTDLTDKLHFGSQILGRELGQFGGNKAELDWANLDYCFADWLGLRAGKIKMVYGLYNETRDIDMLRTSVLLPQSVYNESWRDSCTRVLGASLYGTVPFSVLGDISYYIIYGDEVSLDSDSGLSKYINNRISIDIYDYDLSETLNYKLQWNTPVHGLKFNYTFLSWDMTIKAKTLQTPMWLYMSRNITASLGREVNITDMNYVTECENHVVSAEYTRNNLTLVCEYMIIELNDLKFNAVNIPNAHDITVYNSNNEEIEGFYFGGSYRFSVFFELGIYYSEYYPNPEDKDGKILKSQSGQPESNAWLKDITISSRFDFTPNLSFKLEGHFMDGSAIMLVEENLNSSGRPVAEKDWFLLASKITYNF